MHAMAWSTCTRRWCAGWGNILVLGAGAQREMHESELVQGVMDAFSMRAAALETRRGAPCGKYVARHPTAPSTVVGLVGWLWLHVCIFAGLLALVGAT